MKNFALLTLVLLTSTQLMAQQEDLKTKSISVFKNGQSFIIKEGTVATTDKVYTLDRVPKALFGTFWFLGLKSDIAQVTSKVESVDEPVERKASSFMELLYANKGKQISLTTNDDKVYSGVVEDFDLPEEINSFLQLKEAELNEKYGSTYNAGLRLFPNASPVLLLKMNSKWISIDPAAIKTVEFSDKPERTTKSKVRIQKPLVKVQFANGGEQQLSMMYLQNGISWTPTYLMELTSETEARLRLQAEVVNDVEDIANTDINFVVGVPNFKYANNVATLTSFATTVVPRIYSEYDNNSRFSNAFASQVMDYSKDEVSAEESYTVVENVEADAAEDFYFYSVKNVKLEKGGRAHYPLYNTLVKIKHLYECRLPSALNESNVNYGDNFSFDTKQSNVFHSIQIKNETNSPFTSGAVVIIDAKTQKPLAQDLVKYTGVGQKSSVQLTQSPDVKVEEKEKIISTQPVTRKINGYACSLVTIQSEVTVASSKKEDIELAITKLITGKSKSATIKYDSRPVVNSNGSRINTLDNLKFDMTVKAGQTLTFTYTYELYIYS